MDSVVRSRLTFVAKSESPKSGCRAHKGERKQDKLFFFQKETASEEGSMMRGEIGNIFVCKIEKIFLE